LTYGGELIVCGHCGHPVTRERKTKATKYLVDHQLIERVEQIGALHGPAAGSLAG
jgi:hypothetical protein